MSKPFSFAIRLPPHPHSVGLARSVIRSLSWAIDDEHLEQAELVLSEIVTNAIRHGSVGTSEPIEIEIVAEPTRLVGRVRDSGPAFAPPEPSFEPVPGQIGGYGLHIAQALSDVEIEHSDSGNIVTFAVPAAANS